MKHTNHLKKNEDFQTVLQKKQNVTASAFVIYASANKQAITRVGISVSKKLGIAVIRNQIKRQIRMMCDDVIDYTKAVDWVIIVRKPYLDQDYQANLNQLNKLISQLLLRVQE